MCGRYTLSKPLEVIAKHFKVVDPELKFVKRYNIAPSQKSLIMVGEKNH